VIEALHDPLSPPDWLVRILRSIIQPFMGVMLDTGHDLSLCCAVGLQLVCDHHSGRPSLALQELAQSVAWQLLHFDGFARERPTRNRRGQLRATANASCRGLKQRPHRDATCPQVDRMIDDGSRWQRCGRISPPTAGRSDARQ